MTFYQPQPRHAKRRGLGQVQMRPRYETPEEYGLSVSQLFEQSLRLRIRIRGLTTPPMTPLSFEKLALLKAQCLDHDSVYRETVAAHGYDPLDRMSLRLDASSGS